VLSLSLAQFRGFQCSVAPKSGFRLTAPADHFGSTCDEFDAIGDLLVRSLFSLATLQHREWSRPIGDFPDSVGRKCAVENLKSRFSFSES